MNIQIITSWSPKEMCEQRALGDIPYTPGAKIEPLAPGCAVTTGNLAGQLHALIDGNPIESEDNRSAKYVRLSHGGKQ